MITTDTTNKFGTTVAKDLRTVMQGKVAIAGEASYEGARRVFNGAVDWRPALFAFCESARDVQEAVRAARDSGVVRCLRTSSMVRAAQCSGPISLDLSTLSLNPAVTILRQTGNLLEASPGRRRLQL